MQINDFVDAKSGKMKSFDIVEFDSYLSLLIDGGKDGCVRFPC